MPRRALLLCLLLPAALIFLRLPGLLLHAQFWAEDGAVFFRDAFERGALRPLVETYSGYLHTLPRLVAALSLLAPLERAPLVFNLTAFLVMLVPALYLLSGRMREEIPGVGGRLLCAAVYAALPASHSTYLNITSSQWYLAVTACLVCASSPPVTLWQRLADALLLGICALSSPLGFVFLPPVAWRAVREWRRKGGAAPFVALAVLGLGVAVQALATLGSLRVAQSFRPETSALLLLKEVVMFGFFNAVLGVKGNMERYASFGTGAHLLGLAVLLFLALAAVRIGSRLLLTLLYGALAVVVLRHAFPLPGQVFPTTPNADTRYYLLFVCFTLLAALLLALRGGAARFAGLAVLAPALFVGVRGDYLLGPALATHYADQIAVFRTLPRGSEFSFPILPFPWQVTLTSREDPGGASPLAHRRALAARTSSFLAPVERRAGGGGWVTFKGLAVDQPAQKPAGGVFVVVDGRLYPATTGLAAAADRTLPEALKYAAFARDVPLRALGPGRHSVQLVVLSHDGGSYFEPTNPTAFELP